MKPMQYLLKKHAKNCQFVFDRYEALLKLPKGGKIAEVGVLAGDLSEWMLNQMNPTELHLIDIYHCDDFPGHHRFRKSGNYQFVFNRFEKEIAAGRVLLKKGNSWDMLATYPDGYFDLIYIDAAHDYRSVRNDLEASRKKIKPDGYIVMNDYIMYDHLANIPYGVVQATNEFCITYNWELLYFAFHSNLFCDVVLRKMQDK